MGEFSVILQIERYFKNLNSPNELASTSLMNIFSIANSQTGTGKTYTMVGEEQPSLTSTQEDVSESKKQF